MRGAEQEFQSVDAVQVERRRTHGEAGQVEPDRLDTALQEALNHKGPTVIEVPIPTLTPPFQVPPRTAI